MLSSAKQAGPAPIRTMTAAKTTKERTILRIRIPLTLLIRIRHCNHYIIRTEDLPYSNVYFSPARTAFSFILSVSYLCLFSSFAKWTSRNCSGLPL